MQTQAIEISRSEARGLYRKYKSHVHYSTPIDDEIRRAYHHLAQGRLVIRALASVASADIDKITKLPKLAICRADATECWLRTRRNGAATMSANAHVHNLYSWRGNDLQSRSRIEFREGTFVGVEDKWTLVTTVPIVPVHLRPKRGLQNYHILWEVEEWIRVAPKDPFLLRRIGKGDLWAVMAMWDLTEVERAALQGRSQNV